MPDAEPPADTYCVPPEDTTVLIVEPAENTVCRPSLPITVPLARPPREMIWRPPESSVPLAAPPEETVWVPPEDTVVDAAVPRTVCWPPLLMVVPLTVWPAEMVETQAAPPGRAWLLQACACTAGAIAGSASATSAAGTRRLTVAPGMASRSAGAFG